MTPALELDLTRSLTPVRGRARFGRHGDMPAPKGEMDAARGLRFPLADGGFMLASGGVINDAAGTLDVVFTPARPRPAGALAQAWGQYAPLIELTGDGVRLDVYGYASDTSVRFEAEQEYTLRFAWDHRTGFTLRIQPKGGPAQTLRRRHAWEAYRQTFAPFSIAGMASEPRFRKWTPGFEGWVKSVTVWDAPLDVAGPIEVNERGERIAPPFAPHPGVKVLALDHPPIRPDPLKLVQLPDRPDDLRKTRRVCELDKVVEKCRTEMEIFSMLTWHVGMTWPHTWYWPWPKGVQREYFWKRGHELLPDIRRGEAGGMCGGYAHMMEEVFWSFGFDARRIQVRGHSSFEAYSNEAGRWIVCDASWHENCHLLADGAGRLLGAGDVIRRYEALEHNPNALRDVRVMLCRREDLVEQRATAANIMYTAQPVWSYDSVGLSVNKTTELGRRASTPRGHATMAYYLRECERPMFRAGAMGSGPKSILVDNLDDLYPSRNRAAVSLAWAKPGESLTIHARPVGVTFPDGLLISVDDSAPRRLRGAFQWALRPGVNTLSLRTRNKLGALGYPYRLTLWKRP